MKSPSAGGGVEAGCHEGFLSFRDPAGQLLLHEGRLLRFVRGHAASDVLDFLNAALSGRLANQGRLVRTVVLNPPNSPESPEPIVQQWLDRFGGGLVLEHERIPFPSYPYEWPPEMLHAAATLTLDLAVESLQAGFGLKDATPYNVMFRGSEPVFVDLLSFERRDPGDATWLPYAQLVRTFLLPLLASKHYGMRLDQALTTKRDGLEPEEVYRFLKPLDKIRPPFLGLVSIPRWLGRSRHAEGPGLYGRRPLADKEKARFILSSLLGSLRRSLRRAGPASGTTSGWAAYMRGGSNYSGEQFAAKHNFVERVLRECRPRRVLDVGCNTGHFSALAAMLGASVVAVDQDANVVGATWQEARSKRLDVLPLVVDLCRPSPAVGWRNRECLSFLERASGSFDAVLMLAVMHHMLVTERVPLDSILDLAAELTSDWLLIEFIGADDPMFQRLLRGREDLHRDVTVTAFEAACRARFDTVKSQRLAGSSRWLYLLRKNRRGETSPPETECPS